MVESYSPEKSREISRRIQEKREESKARRSGSSSGVKVIEKDGEIIKSNTYQVTNKEGVLIERTLTTYESGRQEVQDREIRIQGEPQRIVLAVQEKENAPDTYKKLDVTQAQAKQISQAQSQARQRATVYETDKAFIYQTSTSKNDTSIPPDDQQEKRAEPVRISGQIFSKEPASFGPENKIPDRRTSDKDIEKPPVFSFNIDKSSSISEFKPTASQSFEMELEKQKRKASNIFGDTDFKGSIEKTKALKNYFDLSVIGAGKDIVEDVYYIYKNPDKAVKGFFEFGAEAVTDPGGTVKKVEEGLSKDLASNPIRAGTRLIIEYGPAGYSGFRLATTPVKSARAGTVLTKADDLFFDPQRLKIKGSIKDGNIKTQEVLPGGFYEDQAVLNYQVGYKDPQRLNIYGDGVQYVERGIPQTGQRTVYGDLADDSLILKSSGSDSPLNLPEELAIKLRKSEDPFLRYDKGDITRQVVLFDDPNVNIYNPQTGQFNKLNPGAGTQNVLKEPTLRIQDVTTGQEFSVKQSQFSTDTPAKVFESGKPTIQILGYEDNFFKNTGRSPFKTTYTETVYKPAYPRDITTGPTSSNLIEGVPVEVVKNVERIQDTSTQTTLKQIDNKLTDSKGKVKDLTPDRPQKVENEFIYAEIVPGSVFAVEQLNKIDFKAVSKVSKEAFKEGGSVVKSGIKKTPYSNVVTLPGVRILSREETDEKIKVVSPSIVSSYEEEVRPVLKGSLRIKTRALLREDSQSRLLERTKEDLKPALKISLAQDQIIKTDLDYRQIQEPVKDLKEPVIIPKKRTPPFIPPKPRPPFIPPTPIRTQKEANNERKRQRGFFAVDTKNRRISPVLSREGALSFGASVIGRTAKRGFKIIQSSQAPAQSPPGRGSFDTSRFYKNRKGFFIEKSKFAIDTPGEFEEITTKGIFSNRRKSRTRRV